MTTPPKKQELIDNKTNYEQLERKIAFVHTHYPNGGVEIVTSMLAKFFKQRHYSVFAFVVNLNHSLLTDHDKENIQFIQVTHDDLFNHSIKSNRLFEQINHHSIDIVIFPTNTNYISGKLKQLTRAKIIFAYHGNPFYEVEFKKQLSLLKAETYLVLRKWYYLNYRLPKKLEKHHQILRKEFYDIHQICDAFTVLCEPYRHIFEKELNLNENNKIIAISNAINPLSQPPNLNKKQQLLYMGRISYADKRVDRLLSIWKNIHQKFPNWELLLVGDGEEREKLEKQAKNDGLEQIAFCGATNNPDKYYRNASILCLTSQFEGIPLVLLEAQQAGVIPIAFNCSEGVASVLSPNWENGVLIDDFSMSNYENALCKLMSDESLRKQLQQNVLQKAQDYDIEKVGQAWHELFTKLLSE